MRTAGVKFNQKVHRPEPKMPTHCYQTFRVMSPISTHYRRATCAEANCDAYQNGWTYSKTALAVGNLLYAVTHAGKRYREVDHENEIYLVFEPGQQCFSTSTHVVPLERPEFYFSGRGDFRSFSTKTARKFNRPADWQDSFATHLDKIKAEIERG